jgi:hypothetical protein
MGIAYKVVFFSLLAIITLILQARFQVEVVIGLCVLLLSYLVLLCQTPSALREIWRVVNDG